MRKFIRYFIYFLASVAWNNSGNAFLIPGFIDHPTTASVIRWILVIISLVMFLCIVVYLIIEKTKPSNSEKLLRTLKHFLDYSSVSGIGIMLFAIGNALTYSTPFLWVYLMLAGLAVFVITTAYFASSILKSIKTLRIIYISLYVLFTLLIASAMFLIISADGFGALGWGWYLVYIIFIIAVAVFIGATIARSFYYRKYWEYRRKESQEE
jgi:hypothetical protein